MDPFFFLIVAIAAVAVIGPVAHVVRTRRRERDRLAGTLADLDTLQPTSGHTYQCELDGRHYWFQHTAKRKNRTSRLRVWLECPSRGSFTLRPENLFDRVAKRLGIAVELQTGDAGFDAATYVATDEVTFTRRFLAAPEKRETARDLIHDGFDEISHDGKTMEASCSPSKLDGGADRMILEGAVRRLLPLCESMPEDTYEGRIGGAPAWRVKRNGVIGVSVASAVAGVALLAWGDHAFTPLDGGQIFEATLRLSLPALALFLVLAVALLKGRSRSHNDLLLVLLISTCGAISMGHGGTLVANGRLDRGEATAHDALVLERRESQSRRRSRNYYVIVESWRDGREVEEIEVSSRLYEGAGRRGARLLVTTRPGRLGHEWIAQLRLLPPDGDSGAG